MVFVYSLLLVRAMIVIQFVFLVGIIVLGESQRVPYVASLNETVAEDNVRRAVLKAANCILDERHSDCSWGASTARAVVALMFAKEVRPLDANEMDLMKKRLTVQLYLDLMQNQEMSMSQLALGINALYAICENPRNFQGMDLVNLLRTETDIGPNSNSTSPFVLLTLCIAGESQYGDLLKLSNMYASRERDRIDYKALTVMALNCIKRSGRPFAEAAYSEGDFERSFFSEFRNLEDSHVDIYTKALFVQASNSARRRTDTRKLLREQLDSGSFGDLLATYYTIPALLGTSLLDLKCRKSDMRRGDLANEMNLGSNGKNVSFSIWVTSDGIPYSHSMVLHFDEGETLYDVMKKAEARDYTFRFMWEKTVKGMEVYSLAGIPNDGEAGKSWTLYSGKADKVKVNSEHHLHKEMYGIGVTPKEGYDYIFWWKS